VFVLYDPCCVSSNVGYTCFRLNEFLECADDLAIDVPKFWPYVAEVIGKDVKCTLLIPG
jgi:hypothetical protein